MKSAFKEASDWSKSFNISCIRSEESLVTLTIRQLKVIASMMNSQMGVVISKSKFGKSYSNMTKTELIHAIWYVRRLVLCSPQGMWSMAELSTRIHAQFCNGVQHVVYFGFNKETDANKFYYWLNADSSNACLSALRPADRLKRHGFNYEVKVWGIDGELLNKLIAKDSKHSRSNHTEQIELATAQKMYDNAKSSPKSKDAIVAFLDRKGFEIINHRVEVKF